MPDVADAFEPGRWEFTPEVAAEFDGHVRASVPFYDAIQDAAAETADWLAPDGAKIVDLGAATGTTLARIIDRQPGRKFSLVLYDESAPMLEAARQKLGPVDARFECRPIQGQPLAHAGASLTLALFTLQFLSPAERAQVARGARERSADSGAILVAEKVRIPDSRWAEIAAEVSWDYKAGQGIPSESIRSKARALRGVLRPQTEQANLTELTDAGWTSPTVLFRWHQWSLFGAFAS